MGLSAALCTAMRMQGIITIFYGTLTLLFIWSKESFVLINASNKEISIKKIFLNKYFFYIVFFLIFSLVCVYAMWPGLWSDPFSNFIKFYYELSSDRM